MFLRVWFDSGSVAQNYISFEFVPPTNTQSCPHLGTKTGNSSSVQSWVSSLSSWKPSLGMRVRDFSLVLTRRLGLACDTDPQSPAKHRGKIGLMGDERGGQAGVRRDLFSTTALDALERVNALCKTGGWSRLGPECQGQAKAIEQSKSQREARGWA